MKKLIISATLAVFALGVTPTFADNLDVKVVKTKIPEGCEYKKIPGKKKKELVCIDELNLGNTDGGAISADGTSTDTIDPTYNGKSNVEKGANNGIGNGTDGSTNPPGGSGKKFAGNSGDGR